ncbi:uncharacterized protein LOC103354122 isoform X1 [Stegastes partitus]|uniref:Uncharacterized protein LOC103354122 isoform X1 n=1 Tax=Stegastes partitus TaxID=144197 RepID=A0A9Y4JH76_9TELE|nr:PREDICTED: uncharacterized protein LOC103354122 isoform X1 [Stegastes partitus]
MQKGFILIFIQIVWISSTLSRSDAAHYLHFLLGCKAVIPCQYYSQQSEAFSWFYKKDETSTETQIFHQNKNGVQHHQDSTKRSVTSNLSLVISHVTESDEGMYSCQNCDKGNCQRGQTTVIRVNKEIRHATQRTVYIPAGNTFKHPRPSEFNTMDIKWTFDPSNKTASGKSAPRPGTLTSNVYIVNVSVADAGKYTCWGCGKQKLLVINLCVITVHHNKDLSPSSCAVMCDVDINDRNRTSHVEIGPMTVSVDVDANGSLICRAEQKFDGYTTATSPNVPSTAFNTTPGGHKEPEYQTSVVYGVSVALSCLSLMALLIFYLRLRLWEACSVHRCSCGLAGRAEEETPVVYSSIIIRKTAKAHTRVTYNDCIYSEIKV